MSRMIDARVPVAFGAPDMEQAGDIVLLEGHASTAGHSVACACCSVRTPAAEALGQLFAQRARGETPFFRRVLVIGGAGHEAAVRAALDFDPVVSARFRAA